MTRALLRPVRFGLVGLFNTAFGLLVIFSAKAVLGWGDLPANILGYGLGLLVSFAFNRQWTFRDQGQVIPTAWRFAIAFGIAYGVNLTTVFVLRDIALMNSYAAQAMGVIPYTVLFYVASSRYVFSTPNQLRVG